MIVGQLIDCDFDNSECIDEWKAFLEANRNAFELVRVGLSRKSRVPVEGKHHLAELKWLSLALQAEGRIAEKQNRLDDAITSYLDVIRLSQQIRGGTIIDALVSLAIESTGMKPLQEVSDKMTTDQRRRVTKALVEIQSKRASFDEVMENYTDSVNTYSFRERLSGLRYYFSVRDAKRRLEAKIKYRQARIGVLLVDLAVRNYHAEKNHPPKILTELVPKYLPFLPKDDFSGKDFVYRPKSNGFVLYGVGPDGKNDGGKPLVIKGDVWPGGMLPNSGY